MRPRSVLLATVVLFLVAMVGLATLDVPNVEGVVNFYSDETYTTWVGYIYWTCTGRSQGGEITAYSVADNPFFYCGAGTPTFCFFDVVIYCSP